MNAERLGIPGLYLLKPQLFSDRRGHFFETWNDDDFARLTRTKVSFVQDAQSTSVRGTLRGLHFQCRLPQGKLVRVTRGEVFDVAVDLRFPSPTFGRWAGVVLSAENRAEFWIPEGFAHGFLVLSDEADVQYKFTEHRSPEAERVLRYDDPDIGIRWPELAVPLILSVRDTTAPRLRDLDPERDWTPRE